MLEPVRIGVVGCGSVMLHAYSTLINRLKIHGLVETVVACDLKEERRELVLGPEYRYQRFTTDFEEVVDASDVDIVLITTSMQEHGMITRAALEAGKHVLVEKPMSADLDDAAALVELARSSPGHLVPAPHVVLSPTYQKMWRHIHQGDIGKPYLARAFYGWAGPDWGKWFYQPGGGSMFDLGVYNVVTLTGLLGPAHRVTGLVGTAIRERMVEGEMTPVETDDNAHICIEFDEACYAVVTTGFTIQNYRNPAVEIYGSSGTIQMLGDDWDPNGYELWQNEVGAWKLFDETEPNWPWTDGLRHLVECIQTSKTPIVTPEHAYHVIEIIEKARLAGQDGQRREIESTFTPPAFFDSQPEEAVHLRHDRSHS
ncbi:Gfo/Idh/MocA family oxidoreductase [Chloroflexi bacterium TSY]|nr:Gfo/Idh/MocA family oxidoreductase [Chloroflexi bacterium TSY]